MPGVSPERGADPAGRAHRGVDARRRRRWPRSPPTAPPWRCSSRAARPDELAAELLSGPAPATARRRPAAIVVRATWPDERIVRTTVGALAADLRATGATMTVLVLVGDALADGPVDPPLAPLRRRRYTTTYRLRSTAGLDRGPAVGPPARDHGRHPRAARSPPRWPAPTGLRTGLDHRHVRRGRGQGRGHLAGRRRTRRPRSRSRLPGGRRVRFAVADVDPARPGTAAPSSRTPATTPTSPTAPTSPSTAAWLPAGRPAGTVELHAGPGVGTVTLPGLGLPVGAPAINPVPARMIRAAVGEVTDRPGRRSPSRSPAARPWRPRPPTPASASSAASRILGTTGIVRPFSTASWRASVVQQVDVAAAQGQRHIVLSTGSRTDAAAQRLLPDLPAVCFVEVGDFTGIALRRAAGAGIEPGHLRRDGRQDHQAGGRRADDPLPAVQGRRRTCWPRWPGRPAPRPGGRRPRPAPRRPAISPRPAWPPAAASRSPSCAGGRRRPAPAHVDGALAVDVVMVDFDGDEVLARG